MGGMLGCRWSDSDGGGPKQDNCFNRWDRAKATVLIGGPKF
jgi:hypothetical protein